MDSCSVGRGTEIDDQRWTLPPREKADKLGTMWEGNIVRKRSSFTIPLYAFLVHLLYFIIIARPPSGIPCSARGDLVDKNKQSQAASGRRCLRNGNNHLGDAYSVEATGRQYGARKPWPAARLLAEFVSFNWQIRGSASKANAEIMRHTGSLLATAYANQNANGIPPCVAGSQRVFVSRSSGES